MLTLNQLRQKYLDYYQSLNHIVIPSASLVPENDPTTLFTSSGMQPLVTYLLGQKHPKGIRLTDSQKCFRAVDIEEVGDARHITFFEMLGNWSLGDYFKEEQLPYIWNFLVENMGLDPKRLYTTVFEGDEKIGISPDEESIAIMQKLYGEVGLEAQVEKNAEVNGMLPEHRIFMYDAKKNWWSRSGVPENMPAGEPGGPTSEIFYDFGADLGIHENSAWKNEKCHPNCDCGRFIEICNSVLMEYKKQTDGSFAKLSQRNIDFGMSVERLMMSYEGKDDVFLTSAFYPYAEFVCGLIDVEYEGLSEEMRKQVRIIVDHVRSSVMLIADGVVPSSKEQGYILRRLIRRSIRSARKLGYEGPFLVDLAQLVINFYQGYYTDLTEKADFIKDTLRAEESKFSKTIEKGLKELAKLDKIDGAAAFFLYESYGFPFELTAEIAAEKGQELKQEDFDAAAQAHKEKSKSASADKFRGGLADVEAQTIKYHTATHLLLSALRSLVSDQITQKGSNITGERARFDFNFDRPLTPEEIKKVEDQINQWIAQSTEVECKNMAKDQALKEATVAVFADRYPDEVTLYQVGDVSKEICMGPHVKNTAEIGKIAITKEKSASAGVRRVYLEIV